jgi:hypothetical protein
MRGVGLTEHAGSELSKLFSSGIKLVGLAKINIAMPNHMAGHHEV